MPKKTTVPQMKPSEVYTFIKRCLAINKVAYITGPSAIGKSQVVHSVCKDLNVEMIDVRLSQMLSEDLSGLPEKNAQGRSEYVPFAMFPLEGDPIPDGKNGWVIFLDELPSASEEVLAATYSLLLDRTLGGKRIHSECRIVAAGNRAIDSAIARELPDTLITRMLPVEMIVYKPDWIKWAKKSPNANASVIDFIQDKNQLYTPIAAADRQENESFATPRGWESAMLIMNQHEAAVRKKAQPVTDSNGIPVDDADDIAMEPIDEITHYMLISAVGAIAANSFREEYDDAVALPFPFEVAQSPSSCRIPGNHAGKVRMVKPLANHFLEAGDDNTRDALLKYVNRLGGECCELFHKEIKSGLGKSASDKKLVEDIGKRLGVDELLGFTGGMEKEEPDSDDSGNSFPQPTNKGKPRGSSLFN